MTIYGLYARESGGWLSVASLIRLMAGLDVDEPAVRSSISRLKRRGLLEPRREGGAAGYALSRRGRQILAEGDRRIFDRPRASIADGWLLAVFSVPEAQRRQRHTLRARLAWLGFGTVSPGVWIAPGQLADETRDVLDGDGLSAYVELFLADYLAFGNVGEQIGRWWDLDRLGQQYQEFSDFAVPIRRRWTASASPAGRAVPGPRAEPAGPADQAGPARRERWPASEAFADYVRALTAWRRLPFLDPGLPPELLPPDWRGLRAAETFTALQAVLAAPAHAHVAAITGRPAATGQFVRG